MGFPGNGHAATEEPRIGRIFGALPPPGIGVFH
jgi:hypothetical protein